MPFQIRDGDLRNQNIARRADSNETIFLENELESLLPKVFGKKRPPLSAELHIPTNEEHPDFALTHGYVEIDDFAEWGAIQGLTNDLKMAGVSRNKVTSPIASYGSAFGWTWEELGAAQQQGIPLDAALSAACLLGYRTKKNRLAWEGDRDQGILGFLGNANIPRDIATNPLTDATTDPDDLVAELFNCVDSIPDNTSDVETPNKLLISTVRLRYISRRKMGPNTSQTVLQFFQENRPEIEVAGVRELASTVLKVGADTSLTAEHLMIAGRFDSENVEQIVPMGFKMLGVYQSGWAKWMVPCVARIGSVEVRYPKAFVIWRGC